MTVYGRQPLAPRHLLLPPLPVLRDPHLSAVPAVRAVVRLGAVAPAPRAGDGIGYSGVGRGEGLGEVGHSSAPTARRAATSGPGS